MYCLIVQGSQRPGVLNPQERAAVSDLEKNEEVPTNGPWMTFRETAKLLGRSKSTVSKWANKGRFSDNGLKGQKRRLSKASVLLIKREIEKEDARKDEAEIRRDRRRYK